MEVQSYRLGMTLGAAPSGPGLSPTPRGRWATVAGVRRVPTRWRVILVSVAVAATTGACELPSFGAPDPKSEQGESIFSLWQGFFLAALGVGALVWGLLIYSIVRYRRRDDEVPNQSAYHVPLEVFYTAAPVVVVAVLFAFSVATEGNVTDIDPEPVAEIEVIGFQWSWQFRYPDEDITITGEPGEPPEMVIPVGRPTSLNLIAADVAHSFWVPDFLSKRDLIPGVDNEIDVTPTEEGTYTGRCAEFCGLDHWRMHYTVRVVSEQEYEDWIAEQQATQRGEDGDGQISGEGSSS
jgi:cytochrome c oxidase subunit II